MKIEIVKGKDVVELRRYNDDGSITIWLCETPEAALFQAASLLYGRDPDPKRSILVGTFEKEDQKKADLVKAREELLEALKKQGLVEKGAAPPTLVPFVQPSPYIQPMTVPYIQPIPTTGNPYPYTIITTTAGTGWVSGDKTLTLTSGSAGSSGTAFTTNALNFATSGSCTNAAGFVVNANTETGYWPLNIASVQP